MTTGYQKFLASKTLRAKERGLARVPELAKHLFPFQRLCVDHILRIGSAGCFLDTGLGKTEIQLEFCQKAIEATNEKALIWTPLAVAQQTKRRADRWGYEARVIREQSEAGPGINICNYDRRDKIDASEFAIVSCDEASILKSFTGKTTQAMIAAFRGHRFKLVATATPAPNDHMELGNYADFLDIMSGSEMLSRFFINDTSTASQQWRLKRHGVNAFWDWMASWARMAEKPSDLTGNAGDDKAFELPPIDVVRHRAADSKIDRELADMFGAPNLSAANMFEIKRQTSNERAKLAVSIIHNEIERWTIAVRQNGLELAKSKTASMQNGEPTTPLGGNTESERKTHTKSGKQLRSKSRTNNSVTHLGLDGRTIEQCSLSKMGPAPFVERATREATENSTSTIATIPAASAVCSVIAATSVLGASATKPKTCDERPTISMAEKIPAWVLWCDTNDEQRTVERELGDLCISIYGSQSADEKEALHDAWLQGARPVLVTKPSIFGFGCDWSHCANMVFIGRSFSYETWYQAVRRCWRFGQTKPVKVHLIVAEGEAEIGRVIDRKAGDHAKMKIAMRDAMRRATSRESVVRVPYNPTHKARLPQWISAA